MAHGPARQDATDLLEARIENEDLDGMEEAVEVREALNVYRSSAWRSVRSWIPTRLGTAANEDSLLIGGASANTYLPSGITLLGGRKDWFSVVENRWVGQGAREGTAMV